MKAAVLHGKNDIRYEEIDTPLLDSNTVKVKVMASGICGSDIPRVLEGKAHSFPIVLGHEFSGIVDEVGADVCDLKNGDHVAGVPLIPCFQCTDCLNGNFSQCKHYSFIGSRRNGSLSEYVVVPDSNLVKIDPKISFIEGALFEPSTVALHGLLMLNIKRGGSVAILGGGTIGYFAVQWAKILGAGQVTILSRSESKLELCRKAGADFGFSTDGDQWLKLAKDVTDGEGYDYVVETAGSTETMRNSFKLVKNKGQICLIGTPTTELVFQPKEWELMNRKEFALTGSWMSYSNPFPGIEWEMTAKHFSDGSLRVDGGIVFKTFPLSRAAEAFALFHQPKDVRGKIIITDEEKDL
jgi:L-iditol 2-dehydrogenase